MKRIVVVSLLLLALEALVAVAQTPVPITTATISSTVPPEVQDGAGASLPVAVAALPLDFFDDFSWRSFVALNWPAKDGVRGQPDTMKTVGDSGRRVWETWKAAYEIVPSTADTADAPTAWSSFDAKTPCSDIPAAGSGKKRIIGVWKPFGDFHQSGFGTFDESNPLICQNKTYARYEVRVNEPEFEHIRSKKLYLRTTIAGLTSPTKFPSGSIEVKAAWRVLEDNMPAAEVKTYYTTTARVVDDPASHTCSEKRLGLIGLHIVHKTPLRPQWVWSTFEHVRNVPEFGTTPAATDKFSLNDPTKPQKTDDPAPTTLSAANPPAASPTPTQVVREFKIRTAEGGNVGTQAMNARYQAKLAGTVWANYRLVATQWPKKTTDSSVTPPDNIDGDPEPPQFGFDTSVANVTMESYHQDASCMGCHDGSRLSNLDFVFFLDFHAVNDTHFDGIKPRSLDLLRDKISEAKKLSKKDKSQPN